MQKKISKFYSGFFKRLMDFILSLLALIVLFPLLLVLTFAVLIDLGHPVLFVQKRPGLNEKIFDLYKFRTMTNKKNKQGILLPDFVRLTPFSKLVRLTSLDELPELINILKGDMSIVGPRPLLVEYLPLYKKNHKKRHLVRPGLTGLAQINGRNAINWNEQFDFDIEYINFLCFKKDWEIIFNTIVKVFKHEGISQKSETMLEYNVEK